MNDGYDHPEDDHDGSGGALARHAARRRAGVPTVSVCVGDGEGGRENGVASWLERVAPRLAADPAAGAGLAEQFPALGRVPLPGSHEGWAERLRAVFDAAQQAGAGDGWRVVAAVADAVGADGCPAFARRVVDGVDELAATLRFATRVAEACPALENVVRVPDAATWERFAREAPESREKALAREGLVVFRPLPPGALATRRFLEALPVGPAVREAFAATAEALGEMTGTSAEDDAPAAEDDRARSAAERFLFDLLEAMPDTRGLFQLNAPLPFRFGLKVAEADLLADDWRLVVEVDGYRHFTDAEGYRRDRRKDLLLQREGYLVLRVLADDVVSRLEEILADIREALTLQRCRGRPGGDRV